MIDNFDENMKIFVDIFIDCDDIFDENLTSEEDTWYNSSIEFEKDIENNDWESYFDYQLYRNYKIK